MFISIATWLRNCRIIFSYQWYLNFYSNNPDHSPLIKKTMIKIMFMTEEKIGTYLFYLISVSFLDVTNSPARRVTDSLMSDDTRMLSLLVKFKGQSAKEKG